MIYDDVNTLAHVSHSFTNFKMLSRLFLDLCHRPPKMFAYHARLRSPCRYYPSLVLSPLFNRPHHLAGVLFDICFENHLNNSRIADGCSCCFARLLVESRGNFSIPRRHGHSEQTNKFNYFFHSSIYCSLATEWDNSCGHFRPIEPNNGRQL